MIAVKARARGRSLEGLEHRRDFVQSRPLVEGKEQIVFLPDDAVPEGDPRRCKPGDFPARPQDGVTKPGFPPVLPSGWGDAMVDARGRLVPADPKTGKPLPEPEEPTLGPR